MTVVSRTISTTHPAALTALRALCTVSGLPSSAVGFSTEPLTIDSEEGGGNGSSLIVEMSVSAQNHFNSTQTSYTAHGLLGCARVICKIVPECGLWGGQLASSSSEDEHNVEAWIETACDILVGPAYVASDERAKDPHHKAQIENFANTIESHLFSTSNTFLVGDSATAADVIVSILLADAALRSEVKSVPEQTVRLLGTILNNPAIVKAVGQLDVPKVGKASPTSKKVQEKVVPTKKEQEKVVPTKKEQEKVVPTKKEQEKAVQTKKEEAVKTTKDEAPTTPSMEMPPVSAEFTSSNNIVQKLNALSIPHQTYTHTLSTTVEELVANVPLPPKQTHTKNLFFKDKKHGKFLVSVKSDSDVNTKALGKDLKLEGKVNLRLADEKLLMESLGVKKGCVGPMCILNNTAKDVTLVLDERLFENDVERIHSHPLTNDVSTSLIPSDLKRFITEGAGVDPVILPFAVKGATPPPSAATGDKSKQKPKQGKKGGGENKQGGEKTKKENKKTTKKGETLLALQWKKSENFAQWYSDVIVLSEMISYYDISGCYILRPWSYKIWEAIQNWFNDEIQSLGVENSYFPLFVSQDRLEKEKDHVEGFAPEVAWVTKSGDGELAKPIAVRPTSETIMYPAFSDWIKSHRDLPLKLNQWSNVVRWEFKDPTPFLRSREFLWQEGHTAHVSYEDADDMVMKALDLYRRVYEELLAVPTVPGYKTEKEKFAGGHQTTTVEAYVAGSGRAIQGATSHNLGQNFGKMFDITFQDEEGKSQIVWQTSWGLTTRSIGVMIMVHGDDTGLVLPPKIAPLQVVIVPIVSKKMSYDDARSYFEGILKDLMEAGVRAKCDDRTMYNPGWKYNHWEQKGVPIRIEVGPRDVEKKQARVVTRFNGEKEDYPIDGLGSAIAEKLDSIQKAMFVKAKEARDSHLVKVTEWKDFVPNLELNNLVLTPWCGGKHQDWEDWVKEKSRDESLKARGEEGEDDRTATSVAAKTLCIPFDQPELPEGTKCIASGLDATCWVLWGRSY